MTTAADARSTRAPEEPPNFTPELDALASKVKLDDGLRTFLIAKDFLDPMDIGLLGGGCH